MPARECLSRSYKIKEYADAKQVSVRTVWRMISSGALKIERLSKRCVRIIADNAEIQRPAA